MAPAPSDGLTRAGAARAADLLAARHPDLLTGHVAGGLMRAASHIPVVGGLFGGGADELAKVEAALRQAIAEFCLWAANYIAQCLDQYAILLQQLLDLSAEVLGQVAATGTTMHRAAALLSGHGDPGPGGAHVTPGSPASAVQGTTHQQGDTDLAHLQGSHRRCPTRPGRTSSCPAPARCGAGTGCPTSPSRWTPSTGTARPSGEGQPRQRWVKPLSSGR